MESDLSETMKQVHEGMKRNLADVPGSPIKTRLLSAVYRPALLDQPTSSPRPTGTHTKRGGGGGGGKSQTGRIDTLEFYQ